MASERTEIPVLKLKVTEALSKDVGRGIARMGPEDLDKLQVAIGDLVEVAGKRGTVCKVMPAYKELRGQSRIQIDGLVRENAGVGLDEFVQVRKTSCRPAERVVLAPANVRPSERDLDYIGSLLDGLPVQAGNRIRATLFGSRWADFQVESTTPKGPVLINPTTRTGHRQPAAGRGSGRALHLLRGHRRAEAAAPAHPRDDRAAAALSGGLRAAGHRRSQGRAAATARRAAARR